MAAGVADNRSPSPYRLFGPPTLEGRPPWQPPVAPLKPQRSSRSNRAVLKSVIMTSKSRKSSSSQRSWASRLDSAATICHLRVQPGLPGTSSSAAPSSCAQGGGARGQNTTARGKRGSLQSRAVKAALHTLTPRWQSHHSEIVVFVVSSIQRPEREAEVCGARVHPLLTFYSGARHTPGSSHILQTQNGGDAGKGRRTPALACELALAITEV